MSEIPFIDDLGDALDAAIAGQRSRSRRRGGGRFPSPSGMSPRGLMLALVAAALLGGGSVAAATLLGSSKKLADGNINCFFGTSGSPHGPDVGGGDGSVGQSPIATCRRWYRLNAHTGINAATLGFVACRQNATTVDVYVADDRPGQCRRLGRRPLPATYPAAVARLHTLVARLEAIQRHRACKSPQILAGEVRTTLSTLGLDAWRIKLPPAHPTPKQMSSPAGTGGTCGSLTGFPAQNSPSFPVQLQSNHRTVYITTGPPRYLSTFNYRVSGRLYAQTYQHCFTAKSVRALVRHAFKGSPLRPRFATNAAPYGGGYEPASQKLYDRGCVRFDSALPGNNDRFVDVSLYARSAPPLPPNQVYPPASAFGP
ncbi:MAG: hypothetical protein ABI323_08060 [Solirubrobacteraceae bacterium]